MKSLKIQYFEYRNWRIKKKKQIHHWPYLFYLEVHSRGVFRMQLDILPHPHIFKSRFSLPNNISVPFPSSPLDILLSNLVLQEIWHCFPLHTFPRYIYFPTIMIFPSPLHNFIFFPNSLDEHEERYTTLVHSVQKVNNQK